MHSILTLFAALQTATPAQPAVAITGVTVIDVDRGVATADQTVLIEGTRIVRVGPSPAVRAPAEARVVDGRGGYLIPGLWDMHAHLHMAGRTALGLYVANGVTGVRDMGGSFDTVRSWRDSMTAGTLLGPRIEMTAPVVENRAWRDAVVEMLRKQGDSATAREIAARRAVSVPDDARAVAEEAAALGVRFIKLRNDPPPAAYFALLREAKQRGLRVAGHPPARSSLVAAVDSGQASLDHQLMVYRNQTFHSALDLMAPVERADLLERLVHHGTALVPTLVAGLGFRRMPDSLVLAILDDTSGTRDPRRRYASAQLLAGWRRQMEMKKIEGGPPIDWETLHRRTSAWLATFDSAGVMVLTGTDLGAPLVYPGFSLHDEMELQVKDGGRTPARTLRGATLGPAEFLGLAGEMGTITAGKVADLVLLEGNPLDDIAQVRRIRIVVRNGEVLDRRALDALLRT